MTHAPKGTYTVFEQSGVVSVLLVKQHIPSYLILEEITVPSRRAPKPGSYKKWVEKKAPGHSSWVSYMLNTTSGTIEEMYSYTQEKWYSPESADALFGTLVGLHFAPVPVADQRKIGPAPDGSEEDRRKLWKPPLVRDGKSVRERAFEVFSAKWPKDGSDISGKEVEVYLDRNDTAFPFPYWIQVIDTAMTYKLRAVDSGYGLNSPYAQTPMRPVRPVSPLKKEGDSLRIVLYAQQYHLPLKIRVLNTRNGEVHTLEHFSMDRPTQSTLSLSVSQKELKKAGISGGLFQFSFVPEGKYPSLSYTTSSIKL